MSVKPHPQSLRTLADQHRARGGICHPDVDGNGNRTMPPPFSIGRPPWGADYADPHGPADGRPTPAAGQVWRVPLRPSHGEGEGLLTITERLPATDTKPERWACTLADGTEVERADGFFAAAGVSIVRAPVADREPARPSQRAAADAVASSAVTAAHAAESARSSLALAGHIALTVRGADGPLSRVAAAVKALDDASGLLDRMTDEIATARSALLDWLAGERPPALAGLRAIAERAGYTGMDAIAAEIATLTGCDAQPVVQDLLAALPHLASLGWVKVSGAQDVQGLADIKAKPLPGIGAVFGMGAIFGASHEG